MHQSYALRTQQAKLCFHCPTVSQLSKNDKRKYEKLKSDIKEILGAVGAEAEIGDIDDVSSSALANLLKSRR
jgi:hypothetical protein